MVKQGVLAIAAVLIISAAVELGVVGRDTYTYDTIEDDLYNPMMGFAPSAEYTETVGENTLVYVDVTWRELEPEEGVYDFDSIIEENNLTEWKEEGKKVVFRFVCDIPEDEEHMDIPDWLYEKTKDGTFYDTDYGKGYSPDYENTYFIEAHAKAIEALGEEFGKDTFFCYIELGSLGHWGEWHVKYDQGIERFPTEATSLKYIKPYIEAFPNAKLLMRRPFKAVTTYKMGVFNDMTGVVEDTNDWITWIKKGGTYTDPKKTYKLVAYPDIWNDSPVGGEFTSSNTMDTMLSSKLSRTLRLINKSHMTFIGPNTLRANKESEEYPEASSQIMKSLGYRYGVTTCKSKYNRLTGKLTLTITMKNRGVAPIYFDWKPYVYLYDETGEMIEKKVLGIDLMELLQDETKKASVTFQNDALKDSKLKAGIGIENPETGEAEVYLDMNTTDQNDIYELY